eukprot:4530742-Pyramimonas_sp.AAC.1
MEAEVESNREISRAWLKRECPQDEAAQSFKKPRKRHRVASCEVLRDMENMLRVASRGELSLQHFVVPEDEEVRGSAFTWKGLDIHRDGESSMKCPVDFLQRKKQCNVNDIPDPTHCGWRAFQGACRDT